MDAAHLHRLAQERALELPGSELTYPFGDEWQVFKVRDRMFLLQTELADAPIVTVKAAPADVAALCEAYDDITPGYHMNKKHWVTLHPGGRLDATLLSDLITESYLLVLEKSVPKRQWPVDPATFGQGT